MDRALRQSLLLLAAVTLVTAWFSITFYFPDEHYQVLEFVSYKLGITRSSDLPWEFSARIRPWHILPPFFLGRLITDGVLVFSGKYASANLSDLLHGQANWKTLITLIAGLGYATGLVRSIAGQPGLWVHIAVALTLVPLVAWHVRARGIHDLGRLLLATQVGGAPLSASHGFPVRLVAPGRRGYWWVKWVDRIEVQATPSWWQPPFPVT